MPSLLVNNEPTFFVINNTDLKIDTVDGKDQPDRTAITVYQQQLQSQTKVPIFQVLQKFQKFYKSFFQISKSNVMSQSPKIFNTPALPRHISNTDVEYGSNRDDIWFILKYTSPQSSHKIPTWAAYNSLLTDGKPKTFVQQLTIVNGSPPSWENLICAIKEAGEVKKVIQPAGKTITSFYPLLYAKSFWLQVKPDIKIDLVFHMGELYCVHHFEGPPKID